MTDAKQAKVMTDSLIRMCAGREWDGLLCMNTPTAQIFDESEKRFSKWIAEVEHQDGTSDLKWIRFVPRQYFGPETCFYVLLDGLSPRDTTKWSNRWTAISGSRCGKLYVGRMGGRRLTILLRTLLDAKEFTECKISLQFHFARNQPHQVTAK